MKEEQIEKLLEKWGANKKLNHKKHALPVLISIGYKIGQQWASNQINFQRHLTNRYRTLDAG